MTASNTAQSQASPLLEGAILSPIIKLAMPTVAVMLIQVLIAIAEFYFIAQLGTSAVAGATLVVPFQLLMSTMSAGGIGNGISSKLARAMGANDPTIFRSVMHQCFTLGIGFGVLFYAALTFGGPHFYALLGGTGSVLDAAIAFSSSLAFCAFPLWITNLLASLYRGTGRPGLPGIVTSVSALILIPAFPCFIFGYGPIPAQGVAGVGWALTTYYSLAALTLALFARQTGDDKPATNRQHYLQTLADILKVGLPSCLNTVQSSVLNIALSAFATRLGVDALAAFGIASRLETAAIPLLFGFATSVLTMTGANYGAANFLRARKVARYGCAITLALITVPATVITLWPSCWLEIFTSQPGILLEGTHFLRIAGAAYPLFTLAFVLSFAMQGTGHSLLPSIGVTARLTVTIASCWWLTHHLDTGIEGIALAFFLGSFTQAAICLSGMRSTKIWRHRQGTNPAI
ncbi:MATE family efflux transporter [Pseudomonas sp. SDO528_S397]